MPSAEVAEAAGSVTEAVRQAVQNRRSPAPPVRRALAAGTDPQLDRQLGRLLAGLEPTDEALVPVRLSILATCTVGPFEPLLRTALVGVGVRPEFRVGEYGGFERALATADFGDPDLLCLLTDESYLLPEDGDGGRVDLLVEEIQARAAQFRTLLAGVLDHGRSTVVAHTVPLSRERLDGLVSWRARAALAECWYRLNADLLAMAAQHRQLVVIDLAGQLTELAAPTRDARLHSYADLPYTDHALQALSRQVARVVQARFGLSRKVLALDLDNTLWGGVLGEVGAAAVELGGLYPGRCYLQLQRAARRLREQGVILVLASKNDADQVRQALLDHPDAQLRPEAFSVMAVNWADKAGNLRAAADTLGLAVDSFVFMDDSAFERGQVAAELPGVTVLAADGDPAHLVDTLLSGGWFDVLELTDADRSRPALYRSRALRGDFASGFGSSEDYLRALELRLIIRPVGDFDIARVVQLAARTNQFNLTGVRFDEAATASMQDDPDQHVLVLSVADRFGDEGIVGAVWVDGRQDRWQVLNFVLSCRVLGRGIELAALSRLAEDAAGAGAGQLVGRFVPSGKNSVAADVWRHAGYAPTETEGVFALDLAGDWPPVPDWITIDDRKQALT